MADLDGVAHELVRRLSDDDLTGPAAPWNLAATLTASPTTIGSPGPPPPVMTDPVSMPMLASRVRPRSARNSSLRCSSAARISVAARTARSASSSCTTGTQKTASTASPVYFSIVPPWRSTTSRMLAK